MKIIGKADTGGFHDVREYLKYVKLLFEEIVLP